PRASARVRLRAVFGGAHWNTQEYVATPVNRCFAYRREGFQGRPPRPHPARPPCRIIYGCAPCKVYGWHATSPNAASRFVWHDIQTHWLPCRQSAFVPTLARNGLVLSPAILQDPQ